MSHSIYGVLHTPSYRERYKFSDDEVVIAATGISTQKVVGSEKSVENAISTLRGKHLQDVAVKFVKTAGG